MFKCTETQLLRHGNMENVFNSQLIVRLVLPLQQVFAHARFCLLSGVFFLSCQIYTFCNANVNYDALVETSLINLILKGAL